AAKRQARFSGRDYQRRQQRGTKSDARRFGVVVVVNPRLGTDGQALARMLSGGNLQRLVVLLKIVSNERSLSSLAGPPVWTLSQRRAMGDVLHFLNDWQRNLAKNDYRR